MSIKSSLKSKLLCGAAALGLSGAVLVGGVVSPTTPVFADAVKVEAPLAPSFADVVEAVSPAVVSVRVKSNLQPTSSRGIPGFEGFGFDHLPDDHPLRKFFEGPRGDRKFGKRGERRKSPRFGTSQGSGFFVSDDGYIVTNHHVVKDGSEFVVVTNEGDEIDAKLIGADPKTDLAVLKVEGDEKFTYVKFAEKNSRVGEWVVAVGNPFGLGGTVTAGIVSASGRDLGAGPYDDFIQIDAAVNKGNSGGPAFNLNGEVIGVNTAIFSPSGGNVGIAFAISAKTSQEVVEDLIQSGSVTRGWLGVQIQSVTEDIAESLGLDEATGAIVAETQADSPALAAGIMSGDIIQKVDGKDIEGPKELAREIANMEPEKEVAITVFRDGEQKVLDVKLGTLPAPEKVAAAAVTEAPESTSVDLDELGLSIAKSEKGIVVTEVERDGTAAEKGMRRGDVIISVNGEDAKSVNDVGLAIAKAMEDERKAILFQVKSGERSRFVALPISQG